MNKKQRFALLFALTSSLCLIVPPLRAAPRQILHGHVPAVVPQLHPVGQLLSTQFLTLGIGLPLRNTNDLARLLVELYDPASTNYHRYLTPGQFAERFGPNEADYQTVVAFAQAHGLEVTQAYSDRHLLRVRGSAANVSQAFQVTLHTYRHPTETRLFFAPDVEPSVDGSVSIADVWGLSDYPRPRPMNTGSRPLGSVAVPCSGSGPGGTFRGTDFRNAYLPGVTNLTGAGQVIGLFQADGFYASDIKKYESQAGLSQVAIQTVLLDGFSGNPSSVDGNAEVSLDIEMAVSMASGISKIVVYEGNPNAFFPNDVLARMVSDNLAKQISSSWSWDGGPSATTDGYLQQMAAQGQSYFQASGDNDAYSFGAMDAPVNAATPVSSPYLTCVGGTTLSMSGSGSAWSSETVWNWGGGEGSGGGISSHYTIPSWQQGINMTANHGSTVYRNIPDVAMTADHVYVIYNNGASGDFGGTSCAAPLWAGFCALVNQQAASFGSSTIGFLNPLLYAIGKGSGYANAFHDITTGNNVGSRIATNFYAVAGYDLCTGWGTPNGKALINALAPSGASQTSGVAQMTVQETGVGAISPNYNGQFLTLRQSYTMMASPGSGFAFSNWTFGVGCQVATNTATVKFTMVSNLVLCANFVDVQRPTVAIASPRNGQSISGVNTMFTATGSATDNGVVAAVFCQFNGGGWSQAVGTMAWNFQMRLAAGANTLQAYSVDAAGNHSPTTSITCCFVPAASMTVQETGVGVVEPNYNGQNLVIGQSYSMTASPGRGFAFSNWTHGVGGPLATTAATVRFTMASNLVLCANFAGTTRILRTYGADRMGEWNASASLSFNAIVGGAETQQVVVVNEGNIPLHVTSMTVPTGFSVNPTAFTLTPGASGLLSIVFKPTAAIAYSNLLVLATDATAGSDKAILLHGWGNVVEGTWTGAWLGASSALGANFAVCLRSQNEPPNIEQTGKIFGRDAAGDDYEMLLGHGGVFDRNRFQIQAFTNASAPVCVGVLTGVVAGVSIEGVFGTLDGMLNQAFLLQLQSTAPYVSLSGTWTNGIPKDVTCPKLVLILQSASQFVSKCSAPNSSGSSTEYAIGTIANFNQGVTTNYSLSGTKLTWDGSTSAVMFDGVSAMEWQRTDNAGNVSTGILKRISATPPTVVLPYKP